MFISIKILKHVYRENMNIKRNALSEREYSIYKFTNHFHDLRISAWHSQNELLIVTLILEVIK